MKGFTVREKTIGNARSAARIGRGIDGIRAEYPARCDCLERATYIQTIAAPGITVPHAVMETIDGEPTALEEPEHRTRRAKPAVSHGVPEYEVADRRAGRDDGEPTVPDRTVRTTEPLKETQ